MRTLSEQLADLSTRTAKVEDAVAAAEDRDRQRLEAQRAELHASLAAGKDRVAESTASWWTDARAGADTWFASIQAKNDEHRAEWGRKRAEDRADEAEADASDAVDFALYALDQAEYALIDATLARADADKLAQ